jgi:hypothetical protein
MATAVGQLAGDGGDPRLSSERVEQSYVRPQHRKPHDSTVTFEEYHHYANLSRAEEDALSKKDIGDTTFFSLILPSKSNKPDVIHTSSPSANGEKAENGEEKIPANGDSNVHNLDASARFHVTDDEWTNASRAMRTASWAAVFYLITTDILGPFSVPWAMGTLGYGPGFALYTVFGGLAVYGGFLLYYMFLGLDSHYYPMRTYGDIAFRLYGTPMRHLVNILQSIQLLFNVGIIVIANGQGLSQVSKFKLCYAVCCLVFALTGFIIGQVRTLQKYGWLANAAIWMNVFIMVTSMGVAAHSGVNYTAAPQASAGAALGGASVTQNADGSYPPIMHSAGLPHDDRGFTGAVNGLMQAVYSYGGAMLFIEFMAEMKRPRDFWKGMICAQGFIYCVYIFYGMFIYGFQGQYTVNPAYQGVAPYAWQTVGNVIALVSAIIAAGLYGNIGIKVLYNNILIDFFGAPSLTVRGGKIIWMIAVPIYWTIAFIVAAAIPNFFGLSSLIAALCILQFTYTFPPMLYLGYNIHLGALQDGEGFNPVTGETVRLDSGPKRWIRGFLRHKPLANIWLVFYVLGALVCAALGAYSAIIALIDAFKSPQVTAFTCISPLDASA